MANGIVEGLWRYPVKSMLGERLQRAYLGERGVAGDRAYALVERETGVVVTAKNPRKWPMMFSMSAAYLDEPNGAGPARARITLPDGSVVDTTDAAAGESLSRAVGAGVTLESAPPPDPHGDFLWPGLEEDGGGVAGERDEEEGQYRLGTRAAGTFFDVSPIHVLTTATLRSLSAAEPSAQIDARRFRPNLILASDQPGYPENDWIGSTLSIGDVRIEIIRATSRCVMTTLAQQDLRADAGVLRAAAKGNRVVKREGTAGDPCAGVYGAVRAAGWVAAGERYSVA